MIEKFALSALSTRTASFEEDLAVRVEAGVGGIGLWEAKLGPSIPSLAAKFWQSGLRATFCLPCVASILPTDHQPKPSDPSERVAAISSAVDRFAPFGPVAVVCETGPLGAWSRDDARRIVVQGLRQIARKAASASHRSIVIGLEPSALDGGAASLAPSLSSAVELLRDVAEDNVMVMLDTWQLAGAFDSTEIDRFVNKIVGVQIADRPEMPRSPCDRLLPGDGTLDIGNIVAELYSAGYEGWYELETCSDNGNRGRALANSLWEVPPAELARKGRERFTDIWARTTVSPSRAKHV